MMEAAQQDSPVSSIQEVTGRSSGWGATELTDTEPKGVDANADGPERACMLGPLLT